MRNFIWILFFLLMANLTSCNKETIEPTPDPAIQRAIDIELIEDYLTQNGFSDSLNDTTQNGVRYVVLDDGGRSENSGECDLGCIDESDIVSYRYVGMTMDGTIFDTSLQSVGDSLEQYYEENPFIFEGDTIPIFSSETKYLSSVVTYTKTGWPVSGLILGFTEGISGTFNLLNVGGSVRIIIPSDLAYGASTRGFLIPENAILIFDLLIEEVKKQ